MTSLVDIRAFEYETAQIRNLVKRGIEVKIDTTCPDGIAHIKIMIINDDLLLFEGSVNLS